ncbi:hypothetical protein BLOT_005208 [Blomia tropicalis]|nr:hypothetical protein BLOT_005208 [Blomia tropicalis]
MQSQSQPQQHQQRVPAQLQQSQSKPKPIQPSSSSVPKSTGSTSSMQINTNQSPQTVNGNSQQLSSSLGQQQQQQQQSQPQQQQPPLPSGPQINWGKCPELEPSEQEKLSKASVITKCLETTPLPGNITRESVEQHREQIAACALRAEGWFTPTNGYDYGKAEKEIKNKRLKEGLEQQVLLYHSQCKAESEEKYPSSNNSIIAQIQLYQACMDYFISDVCGIEVNEPDAAQFN